MKWLELKIPPVAVVLIFALLMWYFSQHHYIVRIKFDGQLAIAVAVFLLGVILAIAGVLSFKRAKTTVDPTSPENASNVVTTGIYRITRNPMYLGMLLALLGWAIHLFTLSVFLVLPLFILYMNQFQIKPEERVLRTMFPDEYPAYLSRVRRWI